MQLSSLIMVELQQIIIMEHRIRNTSSKCMVLKFAILCLEVSGVLYSQVTKAFVTRHMVGIV